jgi:hypothetical protein
MDVSFLRASIGNASDERHGTCQSTIAAHAVPLSSQAVSHPYSYKGWQVGLTLTYVGLRSIGNNTCFEVKVAVDGKFDAATSLKTPGCTPAVTGGRRLLGVAEEVADSKQAVLRNHHRRSMHTLGSRGLFMQSRRRAQLAQLAAKVAATSTSSAAQETSVSSEQHFFGSSAGVSRSFGAMNIANDTDNGYKFGGCVDFNSTGPTAGLLNVMRCSYEWNTCAFPLNFTSEKMCESWSQVIYAVTQPGSDRKIVGEDLFTDITYMHPDYNHTCSIWREERDIVSEKAPVFLTSITGPDALTQYKTNLTWSTLWGNATKPCLCTAFRADREISANVSVAIFPQSKETCIPNDCSPWNPPKPSPTATPTPSVTPAPSAAPAKKKGLSSAAKIAIVAAAGGGALLLGGGAALVFFRRKSGDDAAGRSLLDGQKSDYSAFKN